MEQLPSSTALPEVLLRREDQHQVELAFSTSGVLRYVWSGRFGDMLIEVLDGAAFVNGDRVDPSPPADLRG